MTKYILESCSACRFEKITKLVNNIEEVLFFNPDYERNCINSGYSMTRLVAFQDWIMVVWKEKEAIPWYEKFNL